MHSFHSCINIQYLFIYRIFFSPKIRFFFLYARATCSELPSDISTMPLHKLFWGGREGVGTTQSSSCRTHQYMRVSISQPPVKNGRMHRITVRCTLQQNLQCTEYSDVYKISACHIFIILFYIKDIVQMRRGIHRITAREGRCSLQQTACMLLILDVNSEHDAHE